MPTSFLPKTTQLPHSLTDSVIFGHVKERKRERAKYEGMMTGEKPYPRGSNLGHLWDVFAETHDFQVYGFALPLLIQTLLHNAYYFKHAQRRCFERSGIRHSGRCHLMARKSEISGERI